MSEVADRVLAIVGDVLGLATIEEFREGLVRALRAATSSDYVSLNEVGPDPADYRVIIEPPVPLELQVRFAELAEENPLLARIRRTGDGRPHRFSDVVSADELHGSALYREVYRPMGVEYQIAFTLPGAPEWVIGVALSRGGEDYTGADRAVLDRARPYLIQCYRNAIERAAATTAMPATVLIAAGLSPRQAEVVALLAEGLSTAAIAHRLGLSPRTVSKHLQLAFASLGVANRSDAARRAWELARRPG